MDITRNKENTNEDLSELLGLDTADGDTTEELLDAIGGVVLEGALLKLLAELLEEDVEEMNALIRETKDPEEALKKLGERFPQLETFLEEESIAFREETKKVLTDE